MTIRETVLPVRYQPKGSFSRYVSLWCGSVIRPLTLMWIGFCSSSKCCKFWCGSGSAFWLWCGSGFDFSLGFGFGFPNIMRIRICSAGIKFMCRQYNTYIIRLPGLQSSSLHLNKFAFTPTQTRPKVCQLIARSFTLIILVISIRKTSPTKLNFFEHKLSVRQSDQLRVRINFPGPIETRQWRHKSSPMSPLRPGKK